MEKMFAGFAADGQATGLISARAEAALDAVADDDVLLLHEFADLHAFADVGPLIFRGVFEVEIKNDFAAVDAERQDQIGIEVAFVPIQHEIRILPEIEGAIAFASGGSAGFGFGIDRDRTGLHAAAIDIFDGVVGVVENAVESFVHMRDVIAAIEKIIDINFPVAIEGVAAALNELQVAEAERLGEFHQRA